VSADGLWGAFLLAAYAALAGAAAARLCRPADAAPAAARHLAHLVYAVAGTIVVALLLGTVRLGTSPAALLTAAAGLALLVRRVRPPASRPTAGEQVVTPPWVGTVLGMAGGAIVWNAAHPWLGRDGLGYHLPEAVHWVHAGNPGATVTVNPGVAFGSYPLVDEIAHSVLLGLNRSFVPSMVWPVTMWLLLGASVWVLLEGVGVAPRLRGLAVGVVMSSPLVLVQIPGPNNDVPAVAWLVCGAALTDRAKHSIALAPPAALALALAAGTKTTSLPFVLVGAAVLLRNVVQGRGWSALTSAAAIATAAVSSVLAGLWAARNLATHGAPFWPTSRVPFGPELSPSQQAVSDSFLERPGLTLEGRGDRYRKTLGGLGAATGAFLVLSVAVRARPVRSWGALVALGLLVWSLSPSTGVSDDPFYAQAIVGTLRYLLPPLVAGVCGLALVTTVETPWATRVASIGLVVGLGLNLWLAFTDLGAPAIPAPSYLMGGAAAGSLVGLLLARVAPPGPRPTAVPAALVASAAVMVLVAVVVASDGFVARHVDAYERAPASLRWVEDHADPDATVLMWPSTNAMYAGDEVSREVALLPTGASCPQLHERLAHELLVVGPGFLEMPEQLHGCFRTLRPLFKDGAEVVFGPGSVPSG
jgi:hypothetical protein